MAKPYRNHKLAVILLAALGVASAAPVSAKPQAKEFFARTDDPSEADSTTLGSIIKPVRVATERRGVDWGHLVQQSLFFMSFENAFRCATEEGTREGFSNPFFRGYLNSVVNLHGWNDGDLFIVIYVGHPMQ